MQATAFVAAQSAHGPLGEVQVGRDHDACMLAHSMQPRSSSRHQAACGGRPLLAGTGAGERQLTCIVKSDGRIRAASLGKRSSSRDPLLPFAGSGQASAVQRKRSSQTHPEAQLSSRLPANDLRAQDRSALSLWLRCRA